MENKVYISSTDNIQLCSLINQVSKEKIVLLCHGIRSDKSELGCFDVLAKSLSEQGYSTIRIDFRAQGESDGIDYEMTISKEIEDLESILIFLRNQSYREIIVLGASFGASIVSLIDYTKFPEVKALILWYGALDNYEVLKTDDFLSEKNKEIAQRDGFYPSHNSEGKLFRFGLSLFKEIDMYKPREAIQKNPLPKLFLHGLSDTLVPYQISASLHKKCANSKLVLIGNGSHCFDTNTASLSQAVEETVQFIKQIF